MKHVLTTAFATIMFAALGAATAHAAAPATVDVQVEGATGAVVPTATVTTTTATVNKDGQAGHDCTGTSIAGALEQASAGQWSGTWYNGLGYSAEVIRGEAHRFADGRYYNIYLNGKVLETGVCGVEVQNGDDVLFYAACAGASSGCYAGEPLYATAPRTVAPGRPFVVTVREATTTYDNNYNATTTLTPAAGASVDGQSTGADGKATVTLSERGPQLVTATKAARPPERVPVCVTDGADGFCGTTKPAAPGAPAPAPAPPATPAPDPVPRGRITTIDEGETFGRGRVPRLLRGSVPNAGAGVDFIRIRLTRNDRGRCFTYDDDTERQRRLRRCGARGGEWFEVGDRTDWQYQLPFTLPRGRWVLDVQIRDRSGRYSRLERGNTRVVFGVR